MFIRLIFSLHLDWIKKLIIYKIAIFMLEKILLCKKIYKYMNFYILFVYFFLLSLKTFEKLECNLINEIISMNREFDRLTTNLEVNSNLLLLNKELRHILEKPRITQIKLDILSRKILNTKNVLKIVQEQNRENK